ncbi:type II toxin-antitoxin system RelE/ParE family toxin [Pediococcus ethanolidurans]|uniref:type II toxin-antitoxin system RelE/ParE family toxin n=1 Tax=Pediococcus ethanolidurans TaxID=319653 RepID=UPI001C1EAA96|nr:type II toxin-antitoxin system YafQ family toxin [Pediococcus ethanolidurans]MBU7555155.1 type II toxin-antitoxin system YafQ family toxin [Pediococcus ethanolidurans]MCT4398512.1 type II toxin-antitoxin system YafQ family toxin [Pediococcus ethanolidurans]
MIKTITRVPTFKRQYKRLNKKHYDMQLLQTAITALVEQNTDLLRTKYNDHHLAGMQGLRELHILSDWLLVYSIDESSLQLYLLATGSHDEVL